MDCDYEARGETTDEVMRKLTEHARTAHNMKEITPELEARIRSNIRDEGKVKGARP